VWSTLTGTDLTRTLMGRARVTNPSGAGLALSPRGRGRVRQLQEVGALPRARRRLIGIKIHKIGYKKHILFTDRNFGLYVFDI
jgi:hypothetical protein